MITVKNGVNFWGRALSLICDFLISDLLVGVFVFSRRRSVAARGWVVIVVVSDLLLTMALRLEDVLCK
jgi:hypothetical protein